MFPPLVVTSTKANGKSPVFTASHTFVPITCALSPKRKMQFGNDLITTFLEPGSKNGKNLNNAWGRGKGKRPGETKHNLHCK